MFFSCVSPADSAGFANRRAGCVPRGERVLHGVGPRGLKPPYCPNPETLLPTQPAPCSSTRPAHQKYQHPSSTLSLVTHTHSLFSLLLCASPSFSLHFLKVARAPLFSLVLFTSLHHSFLFLLQSDQPRLSPLVFTSTS